MSASQSPFARGLRWLVTVRTTLVFGTVLSVVFLVELWVLGRWGLETFSYWFVADATPSPAWLLAAVAHTPFRPVHLVVNLALLVAFGGMAERRLARVEYPVILVVSGLASTAGQVVSYSIFGHSGPTGTLGASGTALAVTAFVVVAAASERIRAGEWADEVTWVWTAVGAAILLRRLVLDLAVGVPGVGRYGHLWGILFGVVYAFARPTGDGQATGRSR